MKSRFDFEQEMVDRMVADKWDDVPQRGESLETALPKVFKSIDWIRNGKTCAASTES